MSLIVIIVALSIFSCKIQKEVAFEENSNLLSTIGKELVAYIVDYKKENGAIISQVLKDIFGTNNPPVSTWISVQGLANEGFMIEIEAQAVI